MVNSKKTVLTLTVALILPLILASSMPVLMGAGGAESRVAPMVKAEFNISPDNVSFKYNASQNLTSAISVPGNTSRTVFNGYIDGSYGMNETTIHADLKGDFSSITRFPNPQPGENAAMTSDASIHLDIRGSGTAFSGELHLAFNLTSGGMKTLYDFKFDLKGSTTREKQVSTTTLKAVMPNGVTRINSSEAVVKADIEETVNTTLKDNNSIKTETVIRIVANSSSTNITAAQMGIVPFILLSGNLGVMPNYTYDPVRRMHVFSVAYTSRHSRTEPMLPGVSLGRLERYNLSINSFEISLNSSTHMVASNYNATINGSLGFHLLAKGNFSQGIPIAGLTGYSIVRELSGALSIRGDMFNTYGEGNIASPDLFLVQEGIRGFTTSMLRNADPGSLVKVHSTGGIELMAGNATGTYMAFTPTNYTLAHSFHIIVNGTLMSAEKPGTLIFKQLRNSGEVPVVIIPNKTRIIVETPYNNPAHIKVLKPSKNITLYYKPKSGGLNISTGSTMLSGISTIRIININPPSGYKALSKAYDLSLNVNGPINVTIYLEKQASGTIYVAHRLHNGTWEFIKPIVSKNNYVTVTLSSLSPVIAVETAAPSTTTTTTTTTTSTTTSTTTTTSVPTTTSTSTTTTTTTSTTASSTTSTTITSSTTSTSTATTTTSTAASRTTTTTMKTTTSTPTTSTTTHSKTTTSSTGTTSSKTTTTPAKTTTSKTTSPTITTTTSSTPSATTSTTTSATNPTTTKSRKTSTAVIIGVALLIIIIAGAAIMLKRK